MKKIVLALAVVFSVALVSCGNKNAEAVDSESIAAVEVEAVEVVDTDSTGAVDSAAVVEVAEEVAPAAAE